MKLRKSILAVAIASVSQMLWADDCEPGQSCTYDGARGAVQDESVVRNLPGIPGRIPALPSQSERELPQERLILWQREPGSRQVEVVSTQENVTVVEMREAAPVVRFESGRAAISDSYLADLSGVIQRLREKNNLRLRITGHTDPQRLTTRATALFGDNYGLGLSRAREVGATLGEALGLTDSQIEYSSSGPDEPLMSGNSAEAWATNRRVEVEIWYDEPSTELVQVSETRTVPDATPYCSEGTVAGAALAPFQISIDGQPWQHDRAGSADEQRCVDIALAQDRLQLSYDNLSALPRLNVTTAPRISNVGQAQVFQGYSNYANWIDRAEIIISGKPRLWSSTQVLEVVPLDAMFHAEWTPSDSLPDEVHYRMRVYDQEGRFDETDELPLTIARGDLRDAEEESELDLSAVWGGNRLLRHNIPVAGGSITVNGKHVQLGHTVYVMGEPVPVDDQGSFAVQQIIPRGLHNVEVSILDANGQGRSYRRDLQLPQRDWFAVGIVDLTAGQQNTTGPARLTTGESRYYDDDLYTDGRLAYYLKAQLDDTVQLTSSIDTGEAPIDSLFSNFNEKSPREFLRRIDPSRSWGTFGDDSVLVEDAPTRGKMYLKLNDVKSHALWGNFDQSNQDTELAQIDRRLYGLQGVYQGDRFTAFGERRLSVEGFAAEPGTAFAREEFLGTGGSLYFLRHQDITEGSESIRAEIRDRDSGLVLDAQYLTYGLDYEIDAIQGRIMLTRPLSSVSDDAGVVRSGGSLSGNPVYLIVSYEHSPGFQELNELVVGGRASMWVNDRVQLGVTASSQEHTDDTQDLAGLDVTFRQSEQTWLQLETAQSDGPGFGFQSSFDGGFQFNPTDVIGTDARANRIATAFRLNDLGVESNAAGTFYVEDRDAGFSAPGRLTQLHTRQAGGSLAMPLGERTELMVKADETRESGGSEVASADLALAYQLTDQWQILTGLRHDDRSTQGGTDEGSREDLALQLNYKPLDEDWSAHTFVQGTLSRDDTRRRNNRVGVGGSYRITERATVLGEVSEGDLGFGAKAGLDYATSDRTSLYLNYLLDTDQTGFGLDSRNGQLVTGARSRFTDRLNLYTEQRYQHGNQMSGLIQAYGLDFAANDNWTYGLTSEFGRLNSEGGDEIRRSALSGKIGFSNQNLNYAGVLEYREDKSANEVRTVRLARNSLNYQVVDDWRLLGQLDVAISDSDQGSFFDGSFTEASLGYAYRPVMNDRLNALVKYTYMADLAPPEQIASNGRRVDYSQRSHVVAGDAIYDLTSRWSVGGRYAYRFGELRPSRDSAAPWFDSRGQLAAVRVDWHVVSKWDLMAELRARKESAADDMRSGALVAAYRHFGNHAKGGFGYNFTDFSDDLTDMSFRSHGWFFNIVGKY